MERKGICRNVGACSMANKVQIITDDDAELKCCECESELEPVKIDERTSNEEEEKAKKRKRLISIFAIIAILAAVGVGLYLLWPNESKEKPQFTLNHFEKTLKIGEADTLKATVSPEGIQATIVWKASKDGTVEVQNGIVKAVKGGSGKVRVQAIVGKDTLSAICKYSVSGEETVLTLNHTESRLKVGATDKLVPTLTPASDKVQYIWEANNDYVEVKGGTVKAKKPGNADVQVTAIIGDKVFKAACSYIIEKNDGEGGSRTLNLGFGTYKGDKNAAGEMHGYGTITYTQRHKIVGWKDYVAEPGDKFEGDFRNGNIVNGYWIRKSDGNRIFIN